MSDTIDPTTPIDEAPPRRLVRVEEGRWPAASRPACGRHDVNLLFIEIAFAALALVGGTGLLLYFAAYLVIPGEHDDEPIAVEAPGGRREHPWLLVGLGLRLRRALRALEARFWSTRGTSGWRRCSSAGRWSAAHLAARQPDAANGGTDGRGCAGRHHHARRQHHRQAACRRARRRSRRSSRRCWVAPRARRAARSARGARHLRRRRSRSRWRWLSSSSAPRSRSGRAHAATGGRFTVLGLLLLPRVRLLR